MDSPGTADSDQAKTQAHTLVKLVVLSWGALALATMSFFVSVFGAWQQTSRQQTSNKSVAEDRRGPEETKMIDRASQWLDSKGLSSNLFLQCNAEGECALAYTRGGVLHGAMICCYDKGCIALSGW